MTEIPVTATWITKQPAKYPTICNRCGGNVIKANNSIIYGRSYGNGKCYYCKKCHSSVGCHSNGKALGILTKGIEKRKKMAAHKNFDVVWKNKKLHRDQEYKLLAIILGIKPKYCHFGYFNESMLDAALLVMNDSRWYRDKFQQKAARQRLIDKYGVVSK